MSKSKQEVTLINNKWLHLTIISVKASIYTDLFNKFVY